jgi:hypothetical protein
MTLNEALSHVTTSPQDDVPEFVYAKDPDDPAVLYVVEKGTTFSQHGIGSTLTVSQGRWTRRKETIYPDREGMYPEIDGLEWKLTTGRIE